MLLLKLFAINFVFLLSCVTGLQIPCFVEFDKACNLIPFSYCDADAQECRCLPNFVERGFTCRPEIGAFCDIPGKACAGLMRSVCSPGYRCICMAGYMDVDNECVPNTTSTPMPSPEIEGNKVESGSKKINFSPSPHNENNLFGNTIGALERPTTGEADTTKSFIRNMLVQKLLQSPELRAMFIQKLMRGKLPGIEDLPANQTIINGLTNTPSFQKTTLNSGTNSVQPIPTTISPLTSNSTFAPMTLIVPEIRCQSTMDCTMKSENSLCQSGLCVCDHGFIENNARCYPGLGSSCSASSPCFIRYSQCDRFGVCSCQTGFRGINGTCQPVPTVTGVGSECNSVGRQCNGIKHSMCSSNYMCQCVNGYKENNGECSFPVADTSSNLTLRPMLGLPCSISDCSKISNAYCDSQDKCSCMVGFRQNDNKCRPAFLTETVCIQNSDCYVKDANAKCIKNMCACAQGFHMLLGKCYPGLNAICTMSLPCGVANSYCSAEGVCTCREHYISNNEKCIEIKHLFQQALMFADAGQSPPHCKIGSGTCEAWSQHSVCDITNRCACAPGAIFDPESQSCAYHFPRVMFADAAALAGSKRQHRNHQKHDMGSAQQNMLNYGYAPHRILQAIKAHHESSDFAEGTPEYNLMLQATLCTEIGRECVGIANSLCTATGTCICVPGYSTTNTGCKQDDTITILDQSDNNAVCDPAGSCMCKQGYVRIFARCYPALGSVCSAHLWCGVPNSECGDEGYCICNKAYKQWEGECEEIEPDTDNDIVPFNLPTNKVYGFSNLECSTPGAHCQSTPGAICNSSFMCQCLEGYLRTNEGCVAIDSVINEYSNNKHANLMRPVQSYLGMREDEFTTDQRVPQMRPYANQMSANLLMSANKQNVYNDWESDTSSGLSSEDQSIITKLLQMQANKHHYNHGSVNGHPNNQHYPTQHNVYPAAVNNMLHSQSDQHRNHNALVLDNHSIMIVPSAANGHSKITNQGPLAHSKGFPGSGHGLESPHQHQNSNPNGGQNGINHFNHEYNDAPMYPEGHRTTNHHNGNLAHLDGFFKPDYSGEYQDKTDKNNQNLQENHVIEALPTINNHEHQNIHPNSPSSTSVQFIKDHPQKFDNIPNMKNNNMENSDLSEQSHNLYDAVLKLQASLMQKELSEEANIQLQNSMQVDVEPLQHEQTIHHDKCSPGFVEVNGHCLQGVALGYRCHDSKQCASVQAGSYCSHGKCLCLANHIAFNGSSCLPVQKLGSPCSISSQCGIGKSHCLSGTCQCLSKYVPILGVCFAGLGGDCSEVHGGASMKCGVRNSVCLLGVCRCRDGSTDFPCT